MSGKLPEYAFVLPKIHQLKCFVENVKQYPVSYVNRKIKVNMKKCWKIVKNAIINNFDDDKIQEIFKIYRELVKINHQVKMQTKTKRLLSQSNSNDLDLSAANQCNMTF